jgi:DMSO/TMAO reductase YedYZ molybdopterin-dependent catalytic subunit
VKYGLKNIKRIETVAWTTQRPAEHWAEQGHKWFAGL